MKKPAGFLALVMVVAGAMTASSKMDIDYSHNVVGTGTVITDYKMGSPQSTEASGKVRGTGEVMNKYFFQSSNDSENVTIEDQFVLSQAPASHKITLSDYPQRAERPGTFRLIGTAWARGLNISGPEEGNDQNRSLQGQKQDAGDTAPDDKADLSFQGEKVFDHKSSRFNSTNATLFRPEEAG